MRRSALARKRASLMLAPLGALLIYVVLLHGAPGDVPFTRVVIDPNPPVNPHCKAAGDIDGDGYPDALMAGNAYAGGLYWYQYPSWTKRLIATGTFTTDMQVADIDGDGDLDAVIPNASGIRWFENPRPNGSLENQWVNHLISAEGANAHDVEIGDFDRDGRLDVVTRRKNGGGTVLWLQNNPTSWTKITVGTQAGEGTAFGDIDGDGDLDILQNGFWLETPANVRTGTWTVHTIDANWPADVGAHLADINGDGRLDAILGPSESVGRLSWYESANPRTGPWTEHSIDSTVSFLHTFKTADIDRDGDLDLVTAEMHQSSDPDEVGVYYNEGNGLAWRQQVIATTGSHNLRVIDIDRDGDMDIIGANWNASSPIGTPLELWRNESTPIRSLDSWQRHVVDNSKPWRAVLIDSADIDRDGKKDIVTGGWWYRNPGSPAGTWVRNTIGSPLNNMAAVYDYDGDGAPDVLGTQGTGDTANANFVWARNNGSGAFTILSNVQSAVGTFLQGVAVGRFQGGALETALSWHTGGGGTQFLTTPASPLTTTWPWRNSGAPTQEEDLTAGDIDRDGDLDLLLGTKWLRNDGSSWTAFTLNPVTGEPDRNRLADVNGDGRLDAVVGFEISTPAGKLAWYEQPADATGTWTEHVIAHLTGPMSLDAADMDGDGDVDVVVGEHNLAAASTARLIVYENTGAGVSWIPHVVWTGDEHHDGARLVDIDNDGDLDIISIGWSHGRVLLYENLDLTGGEEPPPSVVAAPVISPSPATYYNPIQVTVSTATADAAIHYTLDGSFPTQASPLYTAPFQLTASATVRARAFKTAMTDSAVTTAAYIIAEPLPPGIPPSGLRLWLKADAGVTAANGLVSLWNDQSGSGAHAAQTADANRPQLVADGVNGKPAIRFDGVNDFLTFTLAPNGLSGMTLVLVSANTTDRDGASNGVSYAPLFWNETAAWGAIHLSPFQSRVKYRFGTGQANNLPVYVRPSSVGSAFTTTIAVKNGTTESLYVMGQQVLTQSGKLATIANVRSTGNLGRGYNDNTYFPGSIAEVLVYDRALTDAERVSLEQHLNDKYFSSVPPPPDTAAPQVTAVASAPGATTATVTWTTDEPANSQVEYGGTSYGQTSALDTTLVTTHSVSLANLTPGTLYHYRVKSSDASGNLATSPDFTFTTTTATPQEVPVDGLRLWLKADAGVILDGSAVTQWMDQSGNSVHAAQATTASRPLLIPGAVNGKPALRFDGVNDFLTFTLPLNGLTGATLVLVSANSLDRDGSINGVTSAPLFWNETTAWGAVHLSPFQSRVKFRFGTGQTNNVPAWTRPSSIGAAFSATVAVKDGAAERLYVQGQEVLSLTGKLTTIKGVRDTGNLGRGYNDSTYFPGDIAEVLVYARALTDTERLQLDAYLQQKYFNVTPPPPDTAAPVITAVGAVPGSSTASITWTTDEPADTQVEYGGAAYGQTSTLDTARVTAHSVNLTGLAPETLYHYRVHSRDAAGNLATSGDLTFTTTAVPSAPTVPTTDLRLWLRADAGVVESGGVVSQWTDQSGAGTHAAQPTVASRPLLVPAAVNGMPVLRFDGANDFLTFTLPVNGLTGMTLVLVSANSSNRDGSWNGLVNAPLFWNESGAWGALSLSPFQSRVKFRFGTGQSNNLPVWMRPSLLGAFSTTIAVKSGANEELWVGGQRVLTVPGQQTTIARVQDTGNLGRGYNNNTYFPGDIAEVLVYARALSEVERTQLEHYLAAKYGL